MRLLLNTLVKLRDNGASFSRADGFSSALLIRGNGSNYRGNDERDGERKEEGNSPRVPWYVRTYVRITHERASALADFQVFGSRERARRVFSGRTV